MLVLVHVTCEPRPPKPGTGWPLRNTPTGFGSFGGSPIQSSTQKLKRRLADCTPHAGTWKGWQNSVDRGVPAASTPIHFADGSAFSNGHHTGYGGTSTAAKPLHATAKSADVNSALLSGIDGALAAVYVMPLRASLRSVRHWYGAVAGVWAPAAVVRRAVVSRLARDSGRVERMAVLRVWSFPWGPRREVLDRNPEISAAARTCGSPMESGGRQTTGTCALRTSAGRVRAAARALRRRRSPRSPASTRRVRAAPARSASRWPATGGSWAARSRSQRKRTAMHACRRPA